MTTAPWFKAAVLVLGYVIFVAICLASATYRYRTGGRKRA